MKHDLPDVHFGSPQNKPLDWRKMPDKDGPDDDADRKPPASVRKILKVDPYKLFEPKPHKNFHEESAVNPGWWDQLTREEQEDYIKQHPKTRLKPSSLRNNIGTKPPQKIDISKIKTYEDLKRKVKINQLSEADAVSLFSSIIKQGGLDWENYLGKSVESQLVKLITSEAGQRRVANQMANMPKPKNPYTLDLQRSWLRSIGEKFQGNILDDLSAKLDSRLYPDLDLFSSSYDKSIKKFVDEWSEVGDNAANAQVRSKVALRFYGANKNRKLWMKGIPKSVLIPSKNLELNLHRLHAETQKYLINEYKTANLEGLKNKKVILYRGIVGDGKNYAPSPVESWTNSPAKVKYFMKQSAHDSYTILKTEVRASALLFTYKSAEKLWRSDKLKEAEYCVLGGGIDKIYIHSKQQGSLP